MGLSHLTPDEVAAWVQASCSSQGLAVKVTDPTIVRRVGTLMGAGAGGSRAQPRSGSTRATDPRTSVVPHDPDAGRVQSAGPGGTRPDHGVINQRPDDGVLPPQVQVLPRPA